MGQSCAPRGPVKVSAARDLGTVGAGPTLRPRLAILAVVLAIADDPADLRDHGSVERRGHGREMALVLFKLALALAIGSRGSPEGPA